MFKSLRAIVVLLFIGISLMPNNLWAQPNRTPWEMHAGLEVTAENPYGVVPVYWMPVLTHGDPSWYTAAVIPGEAEGGWGPAPNGETIGFGGPNASVIDEAGYYCFEAVDYTYFQTFVTVPENTILDNFTISFSGMDDGARITIINSVYPEGLVIPGSYVVGGGSGTSDLASYVTIGQNRVVITQEDDCPTGNNLTSAVVVLNGQTVVVNADPVADAGPDQNVTRTGALTEVTLDGSGSTDADNDALLYSWSWSGGSASGVSPTISLASGTYDITLTVDDQNGGTDTDNLQIIVDGSAYEQTFTVLGAVGNVGETDPYIQALPEGATEWSQAFLIGPHVWGQVPGTTSWLNFDPDPAVGTNTTTPYRIRFMVPEDAINPSMYFQVKADNLARIWVNDTFIDSVEGQGNISVSEETAGASLHTGLNEIRIALVDWGSVVGINYRIDVTMTSAEDITDAVLTPEDAALLNNAPVADAGEDQAFETVFTTQVVTLDASGSNDPDGNLLSYSWSEDGSEIATGENPTLTLTAGMHIITLTAYDGELSNTDEVIVTVTQVAPMVATDPEPAHGATDVPLDQTLSWAAVSGATGYRLSLGTDLTLSSIVNYIDLGNVLSYTPESPFTYDNRYDWAVFPYNAAGEASSIPAWTFFTLAAPVPMAANYLGVADGSIEQPLDVLLQWDLSDGATGYYFDLGTDNPPTNLVHLDLSGDSDFYQNPETFDYSTTYYWSVTPFNDSGSASGVQVWSFTTMAAPAAVQTFTVYGAIGNAGDQDPYIQALPEGATEWQQAYLIGPHPWGQVEGTTSWINFDPDPSVGVNTRTPYRIRFIVPEDYTNPSMVFQIKADNRAIIWVNDTFIDSVDGQNTLDVPDAIVSEALHTGLNEIRISLVDWGSIVGINYRIDVTMTSAEDISDAVLTPEDAALLNHAPVADAGEDAMDETYFPGMEGNWLDASGSYDDDGNLLSYSWSENGIEIATGVNPSVYLSAGSHTITLTAYDGELSSTDDVVVSITQLSPLAATDPVPADGAVGVVLDQQLSWVAPLGATGYRLSLGTDDPPTSIVSDLDLGSSEQFLPEALDYSTSYYWTITPYNEVGDAMDVVTWSFTTVDDNMTGEGETCETPFTYGDVNGPAMIGNLASGAHDWYSFSTDGSYSLISISLCNSSGVGDTQLALFADCADVVDLPDYGDFPTGAMAHNDDFCGTLSQINAEDLAAGTYYVAVYGYSSAVTGTYEFEISGTSGACDGLVDNYEPNDDMISATPAEDGSNFNAALCPTEDSDWFVVSGLAGGTITAETHILNFDDLATDTWLNLYDAEGNLLDSDDDGGAQGYTSMISYVLPSSGIYYYEVSVSSWAAGSVFDYSIEFMVDGPPAAAPQNLVATGGDGVVDLTWQPAPIDPLFFRNTNSVSALKTSNPKTNLHPEKARLAAIYAQKRAYSYAHPIGNGMREAGDTCGEAFNYGSVNSAPMTGELAAAGQEWYSFTTDGSYPAISISLCNSAGVEDPQLAVFADCGDVVGLPYFAEPPVGAIAHNDDECGLMPEITLTELAAGTYYVVVYGYTEFQNGAFELAINESVADPCDVFVDIFEPNNEAEVATPVQNGSVLNASLCPTDDNDWYVIAGSALQIITFETLPLSLEGNATDTYLNLFDSEGTLLDSDDDGGAIGFTSMISYQLPADGLYYFQVLVSSYAEGSVFDYIAVVTVDDATQGMVYNIYRDGQLYVSGVNMNMFPDFGVENGTTYCYTVTQIMDNESESAHSNEDCATPEATMLGDLCSNPIPLMLPAMGVSGNSDGFSNDYNLSDFMSGIDIVYSFFIPEDGTISGSIADGGNEWTAMFIMDGCPDMEGALIAEASGSSGGSFQYAPIAAGDYFLIVSNWPSPDAFTYTFDLDYRVGQPPLVDLLSPVANMMVSTLTPEFLWQSCPVPYDVPNLLIGGDKGDVLAAEEAEAGNNSVDLIMGYDFYLGMTPDLSDAMAVEVVGGRYTPAEALLENQVYYWTVSANNDDGSVFYSDTASFWTNSTNSVPLAFGVISPSTGGTLETLMPTFSWEPAMEVDLYDEVTYNIYMGSSIAGLEMVDTGELQGIMGTEFTLIEPLEDNTTYYWTVEARDHQGATTYNLGGYQSFHVNVGNDAPSVVDLVTPDSVLVLSLNPEMYWTPSIDVDPLDVVSYEMHWWGADMVYDSVLTDTHSVILPRVLADNSIYYWNVIAMDAHGGMSQSEDAFFWSDLVPEAPLDFALLSPADNASGLSDLPVFEWEVANDPDPMDYANYTLEVAADSNFTQLVYTTQTNTAVGFEMTESLPVNAEYWWRVIATDSDSLATVSDTYKFTVGVVSVDIIAALPDQYIMQQNYPNPFNPTTTLRYGIPEDANVTLLIYDVRGNLVKTIESGYQPAGWYEAKWNGLSESGQIVSTGLYMARFQAGSYSKVVKMLFLK